jgi:hypothetical protein
MAPGSVVPAAPVKAALFGEGVISCTSGGGFRVVVTTKLALPKADVAVTVAVENERPGGRLVARKLVLARPLESVVSVEVTTVP